MSGYVYLQADIRKVSYTVEKRGLFVLGFTSGVSSQIETIDALIKEHATFATVPDNSKVHLVGRIKKEKEIDGRAVYLFIVDEIVAENVIKRKAIDESPDASTSKRTK